MQSLAEPHELGVSALSWGSAVILLSPVIITTSDTVENRPLRLGMAWRLGPSWYVTLLHKFEFPFDHLLSYDVIRLHVQIHIIHQVFWSRVLCSLFVVPSQLHWYRRFGTPWWPANLGRTFDCAECDRKRGNERMRFFRRQCYQGPCESTWVNVCTTCVQSLNLTKLPEWSWMDRFIVLTNRQKIAETNIKSPVLVTWTF